MTRSKLVNVLIGKSILEVILVGGVAVAFYVNAFPPFFHGWGEATSNSIAGWAVNNMAEWDRVQVQLFIDGKFVATQTAAQSRPDVFAQGWARDEWHGYNFVVCELAEGVHEARVYAVHESGGGVRVTLQQLGDPIRFAVNSQGAFTDLTKSKPSRP